MFIHISSTACLCIWLNGTTFCSHSSSSRVYAGFRKTAAILPAISFHQLVAAVDPHTAGVENSSTLFWVSRWPSPHGGLDFHSSSTCKGSHSHFGVCANIQPSFSPGNRQAATILIWEHIHSHDYHRFQALHQHSNIFQLNATKYKTCEEQAASKRRRVVHLRSFVSQGACYWRLDSEWTMCYASAKLMNAASQSKKNQACEVQETGFSLSVHKFQSFNICLASSSCTLQLTKSLPTSGCPAALCTSATAGETIQDEKCERRILFSYQKKIFGSDMLKHPSSQTMMFQAGWWQMIYQWPMTNEFWLLLLILPIIIIVVQMVSIVVAAVPASSLPGRCLSREISGGCPWLTKHASQNLLFEGGFDDQLGNRVRRGLYIHVSFKQSNCSVIVAFTSMLVESVFLDHLCSMMFLLKTSCDDP